VFPADPQFTHLGCKYHKGCFKCKDCNIVLNVNKAKTRGQDLFCEKHYPADKATAVADSMHTKSARAAPAKAYKPGGFNSAQKGTGEKPTQGIDMSIQKAMTAPKKSYGVKSYDDEAEGGRDNTGPSYKGEPAAAGGGGGEAAAAEEPAAEEPAAEEPAAEEPAAEEPAAAGGGGGGKQCRATHDYEAEGDDELGFSEGDIIDVVHFIDEGWWQGSLNGKEGMFPSTYVELIE